MNNKIGANNSDQTASDPMLRALGAFEHEENDRVLQIEAAVDNEDVAALQALLGGTRESAEAMIEQLRAPDAATREQWLDRWDTERKVRRLTPKTYAVAGAAIAAAAAVAGLFVTPPNAAPFPKSSAEIVSRPAEHLSAEEVQPVVLSGEPHREVAGDLLRITVTSEEAQPLAVDASAAWQIGGTIQNWPLAGAVERDDELHSTIVVRIPDDARGVGTLILTIAPKGELSNARSVRVLQVSPPIAVEPNISRKENLSP